jgi:hypothetical protein
MNLATNQADEPSNRTKRMNLQLRCRRERQRRYKRGSIRSRHTVAVTNTNGRAYGGIVTVTVTVAVTVAIYAAGCKNWTNKVAY